MSRRKRAFAWVLVAGCFAGAAGALALPSVAEQVVREAALPKAEARLGRHIDVGDVTFRWGRIELRDVVVRGAGQPSPMQAPRVSVRFDMLPLLRGEVVLRSIVLERPRLTVVRNDRGEDNVSDLIGRLRGRKEAHEGGDGADGGGARRRGSDEVCVEGGMLTVEDDALGALEVGKIDACAAREGTSRATLADVDARLAAGPTARARSVSVTFSVKDGHLQGLPSLSVEGGEARIWKGFAVSGVQGGVVPDGAESDRVTIDLRGGYGGVDKVLWSAKGWAAPRARQGQLQLVAARFELGALAPILAGTPIIDPNETQVDAMLDLRFVPDDKDATHVHDALDFRGNFHLDGLNVFHPMLGQAPVRHLGFDAAARGRLEPRARTIHLDGADVNYRGLHAHLELDASKLERLRGMRLSTASAPPAKPGTPPAGAGAANGAAAAPLHIPAVRARLTVDPVPCQTALAALPAELTPKLQGFKLQGTFKSEIRLDIDPDKLDAMELGSDIGIDGCTVTQAPAAMEATRLRGTFDHAVEVEPGSWLAFPVGPENPEWVPFAEISPHLVNSIMTTEDSNFLQHRGFIGREFKTALKSNLMSGYFRFGASSITMQFVKNVLLSREKTLARKLQELFLTWYVERTLSKSRILEIYFNVIEYGPGIYGIGRAAKHYFGKLAKDLAPREATFFSSILPSPKKRYVHYCRGPELDLKWELYLNRILRRMHERGRLTDEEFQKAIDSKLKFDIAEAMPAEKCLELVKRLTVSPGGNNNIPIPLGRALEPAGPAAAGGDGEHDPNDTGADDDPPEAEPGAEP